ncbi:MAG: tRNA glutamyl-Q(34) synthetase GluQRS [Pseudomonadota bacterium]
MSLPNDNSVTGTIATGRPYVGRFAPSPTGPLHLGSLFAALVSLLDARKHAGRWLLRIEDIDPPREVAGATDAILKSLESHALLWDGNLTFQRDSTDRFLNAIEQLRQADHLFYCDCARKSLLAARSLNAYPGTCRHKRLDSGALRVRVYDTIIEFHDRWQGAQKANLGDRPGDFVIRRRDLLFAYQLAVIVDDHASGVTDVVRGIDLIDSTPRQIHLQALLKYEHPRYGHFPVLTDREGSKLSKQTGSTPIDDADASANLERCLNLLGMPLASTLRGAPCTEIVDWAIEHYEPCSLLKSKSPFMVAT